MSEKEPCKYDDCVIVSQGVVHSHHLYQMGYKDGQMAKAKERRSLPDSGANLIIKLAELIESLTTTNSELALELINTEVSPECANYHKGQLDGYVSSLQKLTELHADKKLAYDFVIDAMAEWLRAQIKETTSE